MRLYKRGKFWWCEFRVDKAHYRYSCKTDNYNLAKELAAARYADVLRENANLYYVIGYNRKNINRKN